MDRRLWRPGGAASRRTGSPRALRGAAGNVPVGGAGWVTGRAGQDGSLAERGAGWVIGRAGRGPHALMVMAFHARSAPSACFAVDMVTSLGVRPDSVMTLSVAFAW